MKRWKLMTLTGLGSGVLVASIGIAAVVPLILKLKNGLDNFIPNDERPFHNLTQEANSTGINYISLGDSESAGYSAYMGQDYLSYADFLANDMKKANVLHSYKNFSVSGALIADVHKEITRTPSIMFALKKADLITITIGANDLLSYLKIFEAEFGLNIGSMLGFPSIPYNNNRSGLDPSGNPNDPITSDKRWSLINKSLVEASNMFKTNNFTGLMSLQPTLVNKIYDMITRDVTFLLADLGKLAPNADIIVTSHAYPFINLPDSMKNGYIKADKMTMTQGYTRFKKALQTAAGLAPDARFVNFDDIPEYKNDKTPAPKMPFAFSGTPAGTTEITDPKNPWFRYKKMPNVADIHPSTYGHSLIGNGLFHKYAPYLFGIDNYKNFYTYSNNMSKDPKKPVSPLAAAGNFDRYDESKYAKTSSNILGIKILKVNQTHNMFSELFNILTPHKNIIPAYETNTTGYYLKWKPGVSPSPNTMSSSVDGPYVAPTNAMSKIITGLFGTRTLPSISMANFPKILNFMRDPNLSDLLTSVLSMAGSAINDTTAPKGKNKMSPNAFMKKMVNEYKNGLGDVKSSLLSKSQFDSFQTIAQKITTNGIEVRYKDTLNKKPWNITNISKQYGVDNFGELLTKYKATVTYKAIRADLPLIPFILKSGAMSSLAWDDGNYIVDKLNSMGLTALAGQMTSRITKSLNKVNNTDIKRLTGESIKYSKAIDYVNTAINKFNNTDISKPKNNLWTKLSESTRASVILTLQTIMKKIHDKNKTIWATLTKNLSSLGIEAVDPKGIAKDMRKFWDNDFVTVKKMTKKNLLSGVKSAALLFEIQKQSNGPMSLLIDPLSTLETDILTAIS